MRKIMALAAAAAATLVIGACGSSSGVSVGAKQQLVLWENYGTTAEATATTLLVKAFEKANPNIKIETVSQPGSNYFALLQAAAISHTGPDLAVMWTGQFTLKYNDFLVDLKGHVPSGELAKMQGLQWASPGFEAKNGPYVVPLETQFYIGFYNRAAFTRARISSVPTTWDQLYADCSKLKAVGYTPLVYGNSGGGLGAEFYPWYDTSYMMIGNYSASKWIGLYDGSIPWTASENIAQLEDWHKLETVGCTNSDVLTNANNLGQFENGKAAMMVDGTWDTQAFTSALGKNLAPFVPPYSNTPIHGIVQYPGDGYAVTSYSQHKPAAYKFLDFLTTEQAANIENRAGLIPDRLGYIPTNSANAAMLNMARSQHYVIYPMLDNFVQPNVVAAGNKVLPSVLAGSISPSSAMSTLQQTLDALPADQRSSHLGS